MATYWKTAVRFLPRRGRAVAGRDYTKCVKCGRVVRRDAVDRRGRCGACGKFTRRTFGYTPFTRRRS